MKKSRIIILVSIIAIILVVLLINKGDNDKKVCIKENCFNAKIADTPELRERGLMFVENLEEDKGMLFIFDDEEIHSFWMKNTMIPLDIIWIDSGKNIVFISKNALPCRQGECLSIIPDEKAQYVLEINAGICEKKNISIGDLVKF